MRARSGSDRSQVRYAAAGDAGEAEEISPIKARQRITPVVEDRLEERPSNPLPRGLARGSR